MKNEEVRVLMVVSVVAIVVVIIGFAGFKTWLATQYRDMLTESQMMLGDTQRWLDQCQARLP